MGRPLLRNGRGRGALEVRGARVRARVLKFGIYVFANVLECARVLSLAITVHEII